MNKSDEWLSQCPLAFRKLAKFQYATEGVDGGRVYVLPDGGTSGPLKSVGALRAWLEGIARRGNMIETLWANIRAAKGPERAMLVWALYESKLWGSANFTDYMEKNGVSKSQSSRLRRVGQCYTMLLDSGLTQENLPQKVSQVDDAISNRPVDKWVMSCNSAFNLGLGIPNEAPAAVDQPELQLDQPAAPVADRDVDEVTTTADIPDATDIQNEIDETLAAAADAVVKTAGMLTDCANNITNIGSMLEHVSKLRSMEETAACTQASTVDDMERVEQLLAEAKMKLAAATEAEAQAVFLRNQLESEKNSISFEQFFSDTVSELGYTPTIGMEYLVDAGILQRSFNQTWGFTEYAPTAKYSMRGYFSARVRTILHPVRGADGNPETRADGTPTGRTDGVQQRTLRLTPDRVNPTGEVTRIGGITWLRSHMLTDWRTAVQRLFAQNDGHAGVFRRLHGAKLVLTKDDNHTGAERLSRRYISVRLPSSNALGAHECTVVRHVDGRRFEGRGWSLSEALTALANATKDSTPRPLSAPAENTPQSND